jgi:hypothetical protein
VVEADHDLLEADEVVGVGVEGAEQVAGIIGCVAVWRRRERERERERE